MFAVVDALGACSVCGSRRVADGTDSIVVRWLRDYHLVIR